MVSVLSAQAKQTQRHREPCGACADCEVRKMAICAALQDDALDALESIMTSRKLETGEMLVEEGAPKLKVFSLTAGLLRLFTLLPDGRRQISGFLYPGDYLGLADDGTYSQTAEAVVPSTLCSFAVSEMDDLMDAHPALKDRLYVMTREALRQSRDNQLVLGRLAPVEKLASFLLVLSAQAERIGQPANPVHLAMNRTDIADYLGLTIETVSRCFTKMRTQGLIQLPDANTVSILSHRSLAAVAGAEFKS